MPIEVHGWSECTLQVPAPKAGDDPIKIPIKMLGITELDKYASPLNS